MEYLYYALVILALLAACLYLIRLPGQVRLSGRPVELADRARQRHQQQQGEAADLPSEAQRRRVLHRELKNIPTPWGWPGSAVRYDSGRTGSLNGNAVQGPLQQWIDRLVAEKRTIDDDEYLLRRQASLRTMIEDRYGRAAKPSEMPYRPVKPPMLRDPSRPHDQMDNFPAGRTDAIVAKLDRQPGKPAAARQPAPVRSAVPLKEIRTPWGW